MGKKTPKVDYAPMPPDDPEAPYRRIYRPKVGSSVQGVIVSEKVVGVWVHWNGCHDQPHTLPAEECHGCKVGTRSLRWKGYLELYWPVNGTCFLAELTEGLLRSCPELAQSGTPIRGRSIIIRRSGLAKNSRLVAELSAVRESIRLPQPASIPKCLESIWFGRTKNVVDNEPKGETEYEDTL